MLIGALIGLLIGLTIVLIGSIQSEVERDRFNRNPINRALGAKKVPGSYNPAAFLMIGFLTVLGAVIGYFVS